ncbi:MAG: trigger factor [Syntrophobacteraceae bacterium]
MNVSVTEISPGQKKLRVEVPASRVRDEFDEKYRDLAKKAKIKGFRPGKVPRSIIKSYYGKAVEHELSTQFIQETFPEALKETDLKPLTQADVSESRFEDDGSFSYTALVDICPPFELPDYKGLKLYKPPIEVAEAEVNAELDRLREGHAQLRAVETDRPIRDGDVAVIDFTPSVEGKVFEKGKTTDFMAEIGKGSLHPDFDKHLVGHRPGESFSFELEYAADTPTPEIAGKKVLFDLVIKELKEKEVPELNDEFAQSLGNAQFDTLEALKEKIREQLRQREEQRISARLGEQITGKLLRRAQFEVTPRVVDAEADRMAENLKLQFERQGMRFDAAHFDSPEFRSGYRLQAEKNIRSRLVLDRIAAAEQVSLSDEETEEIYREIARAYGMDPQKVKREYADSVIMEQSRERKLEDKVLKFIEAEAVYVETPEEALDPEETAGAENAGKAEEAKTPEQE